MNTTGTNANPFMIPAKPTYPQLEAEVEQIRNAIGLMTTALPSMAMDVADPVGMARQVVAECERLKSTIRCMEETAVEQSRVRVEMHNQIVELQDQITREGRMIAAQRGLGEQYRADNARLREALERIANLEVDDTRWENWAIEIAHNALRKEVEK